MEIQNKVIAVTGAAQGLGRIFSVDLAKKGAQLALIDISEDNLKETQRICEEVGVMARCYKADISNETEVENLFQTIVQDFGTIDGLINNAGIIRDGLLIKKKDGEISKMSGQKWQQVIDVNLTGVFLCGRETAEQLIKLEKGGVIINISSISKAGNMGQSNYSAAKAGVAAMTVTWAKELAKFGIRVGAIAPGFVNTEMVASMKPEIVEKTKSTIPLRRLAEPQEISHAAVFILENEYFTGRVIELDGGLRL